MPRLRKTDIYWSILSKQGLSRPTFRFLAFCSLIFVAVFSDSLVRGEIIDRIVAIVNDEIITLSELEQFRKSYHRTRSKQNDWLNEELALFDIRHQTLNALIDEKLIDQEAIRQRVGVTQKHLNSTLESLRKKQGLTKAQVETVLKTQGVTYEEYTEQAEKGLKRSRLINRVVKSKIAIKEEDVRAYYENHIRNYLTDESIRVSHILFPLSTNPEKDEEDRIFSEAENILRRTAEGEDFDVLARGYSRKVRGVKEGDLGYFKRGEMIPEIEKTAFKLEVGEVGGPIRTGDGIVLIKVTDRKVGSPLPLDKIRERVERDYYASEAERRYQQWIRKLRERSFIELKL